VRQARLDLEEVRHERLGFPQVGAAEPRRPPVVVEVDMEHADRMVVGELQGFADRRRPHHGANPPSWQVVGIGYRMVSDRYN
jgi:hypothetical protein